MADMQIRKTKHYGRKTENAGTAIVLCIEPRAGYFTRLLSLIIDTSTTAHDLTIMRPLNKTTLSANAAASQAVVNITADPGDYTGIRAGDNVIAANDYCVVKLSDGTYQTLVVSSVATLAITMTANVAFAASSGADFWWYGVHGDTSPHDALVHPKFTLKASTRNRFGNGLLPGFFDTFSPSNDAAVIAGMLGINEPLLLYIDNATAASVIESAMVAYTNQ